MIKITYLHQIDAKYDGFGHGTGTGWDGYKRDSNPGTGREGLIGSNGFGDGNANGSGSRDLSGSSACNYWAASSGYRIIE